ncbi:MAG: DUF89 family protein [Desulfovibrionaceae bacterium]|nr:DUF89 family protein [Desulfovibrionaceae bacterium]
MQTSLDCVVCFMRQALAGARLAVPHDPETHFRVLSAWASRLQDLDLSQPPPALAGELYNLIAEITGCGDVFEAEKRAANERVLGLLPGLRRSVARAGDPLAAALEVSIIGNFIDCGVAAEFDWESCLRSLSRDIDARTLESFRSRLGPGVTVMIIGDNAGEIGLDVLLVEALMDHGCRVCYAVRGRPVLNDATMADARMVGMDRLCEVVSSGADTPGAVLERCSAGFVERLRGARVVLSKGQGNFEALSDRWPEVFFAFKVKCPVVAGLTGQPQGRSVFLYSGDPAAQGAPQPAGSP